MKNQAVPRWHFVAVPFAIALAAFAVGQIYQGAGIIVAGAGSVIWTLVAVGTDKVRRLKK